MRSRLSASRRLMSGLHSIPSPHPSCLVQADRSCAKFYDIKLVSDALFDGCQRGLVNCRERRDGWSRL